MSCALVSVMWQEEKKQRQELKRRQEEEANREYRKKLRFSVSGSCWPTLDSHDVLQEHCDGITSDGKKHLLQHGHQQQLLLVAWYQQFSYDVGTIVVSSRYVGPSTPCFAAAVQARPMPNFDQPYFAMPSDKPLTNAKTPNFASKKCKKARRPPS